MRAADNVYVMYHGTPRHETAALIEQDGFRASEGGLLGPGVYVSRDRKKAEQYWGGSGVILEVLVRVGLVCHVKDHQVCVPVGERWKRRKASQPGAVQDMVLAKDLVAEGWTKESPWHDAGYDTAWVPADCSACVFIGGAGWAAGIREETCVFDASRVTVQRWALWGTERADLSSMEWMWWEDEDRVSAHAGADGRWVPYSRETCIRIESHYLARSEGGKDKIQVMINNGHKLFHEHTGYVYEIDLVAMTQTNVMTGFERRLLRRDRSQSAPLAFINRTTGTAANCRSSCCSCS